MNIGKCEVRCNSYFVALLFTYLIIFCYYVYRKNYCKTSEDFIEKIEQWSREHNSDEEEVSKKL